MRNQLLQILGLLAVMVVVVFISTSMMRGDNAFSFVNPLQRTPPQESTDAAVIRAARTSYQEAVEAKNDFNNSPCLAIDLGTGHALHIVHEPRIVSDTQNQCTSFQNGTVLGLVEMLPDGTIVNIIP